MIPQRPLEIDGAKMASATGPSHLPAKRCLLQRYVADDLASGALVCSI
jgi:hypothetical protein